MEIVLIFLAISIIGYVIYQLSPGPKFKKAISLLNSGDLTKASEILDSIFEKHPEAPARLAECKLQEGINAKIKSNTDALQLFNEVVKLKERLPITSAIDKFEIIEAKALYEIGTIEFMHSCLIAYVDEKIQSLKNNLKYIDNAVKTGIEAEFETLRTKHLSVLSDAYFNIGIKSEIALQLGNAIQNYSIANEYSVQSSNFKLLYNGTARKGICQLKNKNSIDSSMLESINKATFEYRADFFYRYAKYLLTQNAYSEAEIVIAKYLNFPSPAVDKIKEVLNNMQIKCAIDKVEEINTTIETLYQNSFPVTDVKDFYETIDKQIVDIQRFVPMLNEKLQEIKPSLFNRLLSHYISIEQYVNAINLIQKYSAFWESPELLKNLGLCSYRFTAQGNLNDKNYRIIISNWLTAVFSDKVMLNSLESTTWDDSYTFTLIDAIGSNYKSHTDMPENTNYEDVSDTNISIGETQSELLHQFESLLHQVSVDPTLSKAINDFYQDEKESIENIISIIDKDILLTTPYFAKTYGLNDKIIKELETDYFAYFNEESLEAGIPYIKDVSNTFVGKYATAKKLVSTIIAAIQNENLTNLKAITTDDKKSLIEKFGKINDSVEDLVFRAISGKIEQNEENENLIPLMEECICFLNTNEKLKSQCSQFIHRYCELRWKAKPAVQLLSLMIKSIKYNPNNYKAAKSITILINNNLMDIANETTKSTTQIYSLITEVKNLKSPVLKDALKELLVFRDKTLKTLGAEASKTILLGYNLNPSGMKLKKVLDTMQTLASGVPSKEI